MKKSLIAMALMFGAVVFVLPSCGGDKNDDTPKTYTCSCDATSETIATESNLSAEQAEAYKQKCQTATKPASTKGGATPKTVAQATCN